MKFQVIFQKTAVGAHSPYQVVEKSSGRGVGWINRYLDREYVRRLANTSLRIYAYNLLHFVRWWESIHHTGDIAKADLTESTLLDYLRFQSSLQPPPSASTPSTTASRTPTAPSAPSSRMPPVRSLRGFNSLSCGASQWVLVDNEWR